jgi:hypothetical protein
MRNLNSAATYFTLVFAVGFALGSIRVPLLVPRLGERYAELLEMPFMFVAILFAARYIVRRFDLPTNLSVRLGVGIAALVMMILADLVLAVILQGRALGQYFASRDPISGSVFLAMLAIFALMPAILECLRRSRKLSVQV